MKQGKHLLLRLVSAFVSVALAGCTEATPTTGATPLPAIHTPVSSTNTPVPSVTQAARATHAAADTSTPVPITPTATPQPVANHIVVQLSDGTVAFVDKDGKIMPIGKAPGQLSSSRFLSTVSGETVYASSPGNPSATYAFSASNNQVISFMGQPITGLSAWPGMADNDALLAWGTYTFTGENGTANIYVSGLDGSQVRAVVTETQAAMLSSLLPLRWSADGKTLLYSSEPTGIGGYILFGGFSSLFQLDVGTGVTTTLIPKDNARMLCLDDLNQAATSVTDHCGEKAIHVLDLATNISSTITPPAVVTDAAVLGTAMFNPDGTRVAFAMGRNDPNNEQGWLAVSTGLGGEANLIYTCQPGAYASVAGWLDANTVVFQSTSVTGGPNTVWAINADGSNARQLAQGNILTIARTTNATPTVQAVGLTWQLEGSDCQFASLNQDGLQYGLCASTLTSAGYATSGGSNAFTHFVQTFAPFTAKTVAGTITFTGTGTLIASPAEQRMIAEFVRLAVNEASAGHVSAAGETALTWHREGGFAGFCDDVNVFLYGGVSATTCHAKTSTPLGTTWLTATQAEQFYIWVDTLKPFQITHDKPVQPDELVSTATFNGNGTTDATSSDKQAITDFAQLLRTQVAQP